MNVSEVTSQSTTQSSLSPPPPGHNYSSPTGGAPSISLNTATTPPLPAGVSCSLLTACCTPSGCYSGRRTGWTKRSGRRCLRTKTGSDQVNLKKGLIYSLEIKKTHQLTSRKMTGLELKFNPAATSRLKNSNLSKIKELIRMLILQRAAFQKHILQVSGNHDTVEWHHYFSFHTFSTEVQIELCAVTKSCLAQKNCNVKKKL